MMDNLEILKQNLDTAIDPNAGIGGILAQDHNDYETELINKVGKYTGFPFNAKTGYTGTTTFGDMYIEGNLSDTNPFLIICDVNNADLFDMSQVFAALKPTDIIHFKDFVGRACLLEIVSIAGDFDNGGRFIYQIEVFSLSSNTSYIYQPSEVRIAVIEFIQKSGGGGSGTGWALTGNSDIDADLNFLGSSDNNDIRFRRNNIRAGLIGDTNTCFGNKSGQNLDNATGQQNTSFGVEAMQNNQSGVGNTVVGTYALRTGTDVAANAAIGAFALQALDQGFNNVGIGHSALRSLEQGGGNVAIGSGTGSFLTQASANTFIGEQGNVVGVDGSYNVVIGRLFNFFGNVNNHVIIGDGENNLRLVIDDSGKTKLYGALNIATAPVFADNTDALAGGLLAGDVYRTAIGQLMIVF